MSTHEVRKARVLRTSSFGFGAILQPKSQHHMMHRRFLRSSLHHDGSVYPLSDDSTHGSLLSLRVHDFRHFTNDKKPRAAGFFVAWPVS